ncbi:hypothetical protein A4A49_03061 [Nicotiana attenuata]|uniref:Uncharacterized protein n=1 Tax=Nicotiana attenuata TaxID=49451 RepID=A0A1J6IBY4_NICAT|nr:hypothetical protein A4A49_03061 [Nicotiana attenuata]
MAILTRKSLILGIKFEVVFPPIYQTKSKTLAPTTPLLLRFTILPLASNCKRLYVHTSSPSCLNNYLALFRRNLYLLCPSFTSQGIYGKDKHTIFGGLAVGTHPGRNCSIKSGFRNRRKAGTS